MTVVPSVLCVPRDATRSFSVIDRCVNMSISIIRLTAFLAVLAISTTMSGIALPGLGESVDLASDWSHEYLLHRLPSLVHHEVPRPLFPPFTTMNRAGPWKAVVRAHQSHRVYTPWACQGTGH